MKDDKMKIEQRLQNMKKLFFKVEKMIDQLPDAVSPKIKATLKDVITRDEELKKLMEGIDSHRPPKIFLIGRTGVGKSSLINALCGSYLAKVSDTVCCTPNTGIFQYKAGENVLMEVLDTRGIAEAKPVDTGISAEDELLQDIRKFSPDIAILVLSCTHRDDVDKDVQFVKKAAKEYYEINRTRLPVVVAVNKCDEMAPAWDKIPDRYPEGKRNKINVQVQYYKEIIINNGLKIDDIIPVSSLIGWQTPDGIQIDAEKIENLPQHDIDNLKISFDGRYNIETLLDRLEDAIPDASAKMGLKMAARLNEVVLRIARHLNHIFSGIAATLAQVSIPVADIYLLLGLEAVLVSFIAALSGRDISPDSAKEFILSLGGTAGGGFLFRKVAQLLFKLIPGAGPVISSTVAAFGCSSIGNAAISYYIEDKKLKDVKAAFQKSKRQMLSSEPNASGVLGY